MCACVCVWRHIPVKINGHAVNLDGSEVGEAGKGERSGLGQALARPDFSP